MKHLSIIAITIIMLFTSCSRDGGEKSVFDYIPAEARSVARVNIDAILKNSGCRIRDGKVTLSPAMEYYLEAASPDQQEFFTSMVDLYPMLDMQNIMVTESDLDLIGLAEVKDPVRLNRYLDEQGVETSSGGLTVYVTSNLAISKADNFVIIGETPEKIASYFEMAQQQAITEIPELTDLFADVDRTVIGYTRDEAKLTRRERQHGKQPGYTTRLLTMDLHEHFLDVDFTTFDSEWNPVDITEFIPMVDQDVLASIPAEAQGVIVMGENTDIQGLINNIYPAIPEHFNEPSELMFFAEFLKGSFMISATPAATGRYLRELTPPAWNITASMLQADENVSSILSALSIFNPSGSIKEEDGQIRYQINPDLALYIRHDAPLLTLSTDLIRSQESSSEYAEIFEGAAFGAAINVPYNSETMRAFNLPYGPNIVLIGRDSTISLRIALNGSKSALLEALAETLKAAR